MKTCTKCATAKLLDAFHKKAASKDGLNPICIDCVSAYQKQHYQKNAPRIKARVAQWVCENPDKVKTQAREYYRQNADRAKRAAARWAADNPERRKEVSRAYDQSHAEQRRGSRRAHYNRNIEAAREDSRRNQAMRRASGAISRSWWQYLFNTVSTGVCIYCGEHGRKLTMDHWVPVSRGGRTEVGNLIPCCKPCNSRKGNKSPEEWIALNGWSRKPTGNGEITIEGLLEIQRQVFDEEMRAFHKIEVEIVR